MNRRITTFYWMQLLVLAGVHFLIDMFASMLPAILPAIRDEFSLSLSLGGLVLVALLMTSNGVQPLIGHMRADKRRPLFLYLGLILGASICLLGALPRGERASPINHSQDIEHRLSADLSSVALAKAEASSIENPASSIQNQASRIQHLVSSKFQSKTLIPLHKNQNFQKFFNSFSRNDLAQIP